MGSLGTLKPAFVPVAGLVGEREQVQFSRTDQDNPQRKNNVAAKMELASHPWILPLIYPVWTKGENHLPTLEDEKCCELKQGAWECRSKCNLVYKQALTRLPGCCPQLSTQILPFPFPLVILFMPFSALLFLSGSLSKKLQPTPASTAVIIFLIQRALCYSHCVQRILFYSANACYSGVKKEPGF